MFIIEIHNFSEDQIFAVNMRQIFRLDTLLYVNVMVIVIFIQVILIQMVMGGYLKV